MENDFCNECGSSGFTSTGEPCECKRQGCQRKPYTPPAIISEEIFEVAALSCGKSTGRECHPRMGRS